MDFAAVARGSINPHPHPPGLHLVLVEGDAERRTVDQCQEGLGVFGCTETLKNSSELRSSFPRALHRARESHLMCALCAAHALAQVGPIRQVAQFVLDDAPHPVHRDGPEVPTADRVQQRYPPTYSCLNLPTPAIEYENGYELRHYRVLLPAPTWSSWLQRTCPRLHGDIGASVRVTNELLNVGAMLGRALIAVDRAGPVYG